MSDLQKAAAEFEEHIKTARWAENQVYGMAHDGGVTLKAFVGTGIQSVHILKKGLDEAVQNIRAEMNGGLLRELSEVMNFTLGGFDCVRETNGILVWTVISATHDISPAKIMAMKNIVSKHTKLFR
jgi:hypothetical protein